MSKPNLFCAPPRRSTLRNKSGYFSLLLALMISVVGGILVIQMSTAYQFSNVFHRDQKERSRVQHSLERLAMRVRQSYYAANLSSTCPANTTRHTIAGSEFCLPNGDLCVDLPDSGVKRACLSKDHLDWKHDGAAPLPGIASAPAVSSNVNGPVARIVVPPYKNPSTSKDSNYIWRSCVTPDTVCVQMVLCKAGGTSCNRKRAEAVQMLRIGPL